MTTGIGREGEHKAHSEEVRSMVRVLGGKSAEDGTMEVGWLKEEGSGNVAESRHHRCGRPIPVPQCLVVI